MTRKEKWAAYREEIANQADLGRSILVDNRRIELYKKEIDQINPSILSSSQENALISGVSDVAINQTSIATEISDMFATINLAKNVINDENVDTMFHQMKQEGIIKNGKVKEEWLNSNIEYEYFKKEAKDFLQTKDADASSKQLEAKFKSIKEKSKDNKIDPVPSISKNGDKQLSHYIFVVSIAVSFFLLVIVVALFITKMVLK